jgi:adenine-specific DNA-methyltransferase
LESELIKYLGSKRELIGTILECIAKASPDARSVVDLFSGTARVGYALKAAGYQVFSNDHNQYAHVLARCYVEADNGLLSKQAQKIIDELNALPGHSGFFTKTYCLESRFFHPQNGEKIDAIRQAIENARLDEPLRSVILVSLMEAADRVDSTCGIQMAYLKQWAARAHKPIQLRLPALLDASRHGPGKALGLEAESAASMLHGDVLYLDPPYNQHNYRANYHIWETLVRFDQPQVYGKAQKRIDCKEKKSDFNFKHRFKAAFCRVLDASKAPVVIVSFNNEGFVTREEMETLLSARGNVSTVVNDYKRYIGAQIGIYSPQGLKVGKAGHLYNQEYIYILKR